MKYRKTINAIHRITTSRENMINHEEIQKDEENTHINKTTNTTNLTLEFSIDDNNNIFDEICSILLFDY